MLKKVVSAVFCCFVFGFLVSAEKGSPVFRLILRDILPPYVLAEETKMVYEPEVKEENFLEYILFNDDVTDEYAMKNYYIVSSRTEFKDGDIDVNKFQNMDLSLKNEEGPKVLIFHTHSSEMFADSDPSKGLSEGIWCVGEELKKELEKYGVEVYHHMARYDVVDGKTSVLGAYERMEVDIRSVLEKYPTIELVIDMHRDGIDENKRLVTILNGEKCAKLMLFNGLTRLKDEGELEDLKNPYLEENLALSYRLYTSAKEKYPDLMRKIYIEGYRYSLHMKPKSILLEVGAQTNTKQEAKNSMKYFAEMIAEVCLNK